MALLDDLAADGPPEKEFEAGIASRLPRKRVAAGALIRDEGGRVLFVQPTYRPWLDIPGGIVEENEAPFAGCRRELREELGIDVRLGDLLVVDWVPRRGVWPDGLMFVFDGGVLTDRDIGRMVLPDDELASVQFLPLDEAEARVKPSFARRLRVAYDALGRDHRSAYAEFGRWPES